jgi:hypothetical protein
MIFSPLVESDIPIDAKNVELDDGDKPYVIGNTLKFLSDLSGNPIMPDEYHRQQAVKLVRAGVTGDLSAYPNETLAYLAGLVSKYDAMVVRELADLKLYTINKLLELSNDPSPKIQLGALKLLGETDGVDAFKKRVEVTVSQKSNEEIERELMERLDQLTIDITPDADTAED